MRITAAIYRIFRAFWARFPARRRASMLLRRLGFDMGKYYRDFWFDGPFTANCLGRTFTLVSSADDYGTLEIFWKGLSRSWDSSSIEIWATLALQSEVILDIGASNGLYSVVAKRMNDDAQVIAFEPSVRAQARTRANVRANDFDISLEPIALSDRTGSSKFYDSDSFSAAASLKPSEALLVSLPNVYEVSLERLDKFLESRQIEGLDLVSIDVERSEPEVLAGMGDYLRRYKPSLIIEILDNEMGCAVTPFFEPHGYLYFNIIEGEGLVPVENLLPNRNPGRTDNLNYLICQPEISRRNGWSS